MERERGRERANLGVENLVEGLELAAAEGRLVEVQGDLKGSLIEGSLELGHHHGQEEEGHVGRGAEEAVRAPVAGSEANDAGPGNEDLAGSAVNWWMRGRTGSEKEANSCRGGGRSRGDAGCGRGCSAWLGSWGQPQRRAERQRCDRYRRGAWGRPFCSSKGSGSGGVRVLGPLG